jgi:hypothetical protein
MDKSKWRLLYFELLGNAIEIPFLVSFFDFRRETVFIFPSDFRRLFGAAKKHRL